MTDAPTIPLELDAFRALVGTTVTFRDGDAHADLEVLAAEAAARPDDDTRLDTAFSVTFQAPPDIHIEQGTFAVEAPGYAPTPLFVSPFAQTEAGTQVEAVVTRLR